MQFVHYKSPYGYGKFHRKPNDCVCMCVCVLQHFGCLFVFLFYLINKVNVKEKNVERKLWGAEENCGKGMQGNNEN